MLHWPSTKACACEGYVLVPTMAVAEEEVVVLLEEAPKPSPAKNSTAWFELVVVAVAAPDEPVSSAIPMSLQIEVGNGSWESSLIPPQVNDDEASAPDMVKFNLVIVSAP